MRKTLATFAFCLLATPAAAQTVVNESRFDKAPWWMDQPIIASTGFVETEIQANRARFSASFQAVERTAADATRKAADKVRELGQALAAYGADKVRIETTFNMRPIYDQYRDKDGNLQTNARADKIDNYEINANVSIEVRDVALIQRVYATVLAAKPTATQPVYFSLQPSNETRTELFNLAVTDAARRARQATEATSTRLGAVKLIDPTGRACQTDVLVAGAPRPFADNGIAGTVSTASRTRGMSEETALPVAMAPARAGPGLQIDAMELPLQPPMQKLTASACVVYSLGG